MAINEEKARVTQLCRAVFEAEQNLQWNEAERLHRDVIANLNRLKDQAGFLSGLFPGGDEKRQAKFLIRLHEERLPIVQSLKNGKTTTLPSSQLPSAHSAIQELNASNGGKLCLSREEQLLFHCQNPSQANSDNLPRWLAAIEHLLHGPVPLYTPSLNVDAPNTHYVLRRDMDAWYGGKCIRYIVRDESDTSSLYVLQAYKKNRFQIPAATFHRVSEFPRQCIHVAIAGIKNSHSSRDSVRGHEMRLTSQTGRVISEIPDREAAKSLWCPRRFTYAGRKFVWKAPRLTHEMLYEVESEWPQPGSKTGKMNDKCLDRYLAWYKPRWEMSTTLAGDIYIAGGVDQMFREYVLASQLTRLVVSHYGHDK